MTYLLRASFSGRFFYGTQKQKGKPTLQGVFEDALEDLYQEKVKVSISSRLDRGVSAEDFAFSYVPKDSRLSPEKVAYVLSRRLAPEVVIRSAREVEDGFSVRYGMDYKVYRYALQRKRRPDLNPVAMPVRENFDFAAYKKAMLLFQGKHDFRSFSTPEGEEETHLSIDRITFEEAGDLFYTRIQAQSFLRYQIRFLVGAGILAAEGKVSFSLLKDLLEGKEGKYPKDKAWPEGLVLEKIHYPGIDD